MTPTDTLNPRSWLCRTLLGQTPDPGPRSNEDWQAILDAAARNGVTALLHHRLHRSVEAEPPVGATIRRELEPGNAVGATTRRERNPSPPTWFKETLTAHAHHLAAADLAQTAELEAILDTWAAAGIRPLLIKGTPLAYSLYPEPWLRERCDTDVLFASRADAQAAHETLQEQGYRQPNAVSGDYISHQFMSYRPGGDRTPHTLDMHWRINNVWAFATAMRYADLEASAIGVPALSPHARTLSHPHALALACMHRAGHIAEGTANRLIWLYDMHLLNEVLKKEDWEGFEKMALEKGLGEILLDGFEAARAAYGTAFPESVTAALGDGQNTLAYRPQAAERSWQVQWMNFRSIEGVAGKARWLREQVFPPADYMLGKYHTKRRSALPFLYLRRAFGGLPKILRKIR